VQALKVEAGARRAWVGIGPGATTKARFGPLLRNLGQHRRRWPSVCSTTSIWRISPRSLAHFVLSRPQGADATAALG
jgi:hypothetical protein